MSHRYIEAWDDSDVIFTVESEEFHCHCIVLKLNSPIFRKMLKKKKKDKEEKVKPMDLPGKEKESFCIFLDFMYPMPSEYDATTDRETLLKVLEYCNEYQTDCVKARIDYILFCKVYSVGRIILTLPVVMKDLQTSDKYGLEETKKVSLNRLVKLTHEQDTSSYDETVYSELSVESKFEVLTGLLRICFSSGFITKGFNMNKLVDSLSKEVKKDGT